jgi:mono/diheme cytochrome c family protein
MARVAISFGLALALGLLALGCGAADDAPPAPPAAESAPTPTPAPDPTPAPRAEPVAPDEGDATLGAVVYAQQCATCHGATGDGDGPASTALDPKPVRHSDGAYMNALDDAHLVTVIREGGPAVGKSPLMAGLGAVLDDADIANVIAFVRSLADPPYRPDAAK